MDLKPRPSQLIIVVSPTTSETNHHKNLATEIIRHAKFSVNTVALKQTGHNARV